MNWDLYIRAVVAHAANFLSVEKEKDWYGDHDSCQNSEEGGCPANAEAPVHGRGEHREGGANGRAYEDVGGDGAVGMQLENIDDVVESLHKDHDNAGTNGC